MLTFLSVNNLFLIGDAFLFKNNVMQMLFSLLILCNQQKISYCAVSSILV